MRTTKKDILTVGESIAEILNKKNNTDIYNFDFPWGVVKKSQIGGISVVIYANDYKRETYDKLISVRDALLEI